MNIGATVQSLIATVCLDSALAAGAAMWFGDRVLAQENKPAG